MQNQVVCPPVNKSTPNSQPGKAEGVREGGERAEEGLGPRAGLAVLGNDGKLHRGLENLKAEGTRACPYWVELRKGPDALRK